MRQGRPPKTVKQIDDDLVDQLNTMYEINADGCWIWVGKYFANGYPRLQRHLPRASFHMRAHVASYQLHKGQIPEGIFVCHSCDVKGCVNPDHLWLGTNKANQDDAAAKGVFSRYWTPERREAKRRTNSGAGNPMFGKRGNQAPCYGRTGKKHPMFGKSHTDEVKQRISRSLREAHQRKRKQT